MTSDVMAAALPRITSADLEAAIAATDTPAWLADRRRAAWRAWEAMPLPDPGDEEWRRTNLREMDFSGFGPHASPRQQSPTAPGGLNRGAEAAHVAQVDGLPSLSVTDDTLARQGLIVMPLGRAAVEHAGTVGRYLGSAVADDEWKFVALNAALWTGGLFVYVPAGLEVTLPIAFAESLAASGAVTCTRTLIVAERNARVAVIDDASSAADNTALVSSVVEIIAGEGARIDYYDVNRWGGGVRNFKTVRALLGRDANCTALAAGIGSALTKQRIDVEMPEPGARTELLGVTFGSDNQHFDYNTLQNHGGPHTTSDLQFKSALTDQASLVWYGITRIKQGASAAEANQTSRNLLLSPHAKAAPIPILEIEAYDVAKCSHGATAGPVEESELFYLQSRGIPRDIAEHMLVEGFFANVIERIPNTELRDRVLDAVLEKAGGRLDSVTWDEVRADAPSTAAGGS